ncbi:hypothetical protein ANANG_G00254380 [Anguilla anguilla]|uniref:Oxidative stress induced growth inhibitor 1 n=1 Tax=Anguilla anguilla TaxID=7936 RepID=A0A9D3LWF6_ANGAN|nr:hypothetical protein ANANG_G00254380 [Anguilla anguilla]
MDLEDDHLVPRDVLPVVVIGNGPSGICLSYLLSGYVPYPSPEGSHPNPILQRKLQQQPHLSLLEQDLEYLCEGLEGRSSNPVAVLFDSLLLPDSDFGADYPSPLQWRYEPERAVPHVVLGKGPPGGAWHAMEGSMLTLSLANWMELPGLKLKDWVREKRRSRPTPTEEIASYYQHYVSLMGLQDRFACGTTVTSLQRAGGEAGPGVWRVRGVRREAGPGGGGEGRGGAALQPAGAERGARHGDPRRPRPPGRARRGPAPRPPRLLGAGGRHLGRPPGPRLRPAAGGGAGLTAADAVLAARHLNAPSATRFRRAVTDPALIFNQLPKVLYPEKCVLEGEGGRRTVLQVSMVLVLIGSYPNLSFLPGDGRPLGLDPDERIGCRRNPLQVDPFTHECVREPGLYAMGPLVGENFVRFLKGGALAIAAHLARRRGGEGPDS